MADLLSIKRSNIAAYETKNVEPRLSLISSIADLLQVSLADLICVDLETGNHSQSDGEQQVVYDEKSLSSHLQRSQLQKLHKQSLDIRSMLEGFRIFYQYKQKSFTTINERHRRNIDSDVENFLIFIDHMLQYNEHILAMLDQVNTTSPASFSANQSMDEEKEPSATSDAATA